MVSRQPGRLISQASGLEKLRDLREDLRSRVAEYERRADPCVTCPTPGACCLDAHFVNVRITRLEAEAIGVVLAGLAPGQRRAVIERARSAIETYKLDEARDTSLATYACPLFEKGVGCLVHADAKPLPCIAHACYSSPADLPPEDMLDDAELAVDRLNKRTYGCSQPLVPIPLAIVG